MFIKYVIFSNRLIFTINSCFTACCIYQLAYKYSMYSRSTVLFQPGLLGFSIRYCLRMRMVEFCQESTSLLTAAVSCLLLASCSFIVSNSCWLAASCFFRSSNSCWLTHCPDTYGEIWYIISEPVRGYLCSSPFCAVAATRDDVSTAARIINSCMLLCFKFKLSPLILPRKISCKLLSSVFHTSNIRSGAYSNWLGGECTFVLIWWESFFNIYSMMTKCCSLSNTLLCFEQVIMLTVWYSIINPLLDC